MRRFVALLLLCVFSLQACWAVAASYCQHESAPAAAHIGHHVHQHRAQHATPHPADDANAHDAKADAGIGTPGTAAADLDCHACHAHQAGVTPAPLAFSAAPAAVPPPQCPAAALPAPPRARVERPNWQNLA